MDQTHFQFRSQSGGCAYAASSRCGSPLTTNLGALRSSVAGRRVGGESAGDQLARGPARNDRGRSKCAREKKREHAAGHPRPSPDRSRFHQWRDCRSRRETRHPGAVESCALATGEGVGTFVDPSCLIVALVYWTILVPSTFTRNKT